MKIPAWLTLATLFIGCSGNGDTDDEPRALLGIGDLNPSADDDGDGFTNGDEDAAGSNPQDASDVPYTGGWVKDSECRYDVASTGNEAGQIAENFALVDQYGDTVLLHDFCDTVLLIEFAGFG